MKFEVVKKLDGRFVIFFVVETNVPPDFSGDVRVPPCVPQDYKCR